MSNATPTSEPTSQGPPPRFDIIHAIIFAACWYPLNPLTIVALRMSFMEGSGPQWDSSDWMQFLVILGQSIFGPFTAALEGRNQTECLEFAISAMPICGGALLLTTLVQLWWRPVRKRLRATRYLIWAAGWLTWFTAAFISIVNNSG